MNTVIKNQKEDKILMKNENINLKIKNVKIKTKMS